MDIAFSCAGSSRQTSQYGQRLVGSVDSLVSSYHFLRSGPYVTATPRQKSDFPQFGHGQRFLIGLTRLYKNPILQPAGAQHDEAFTRLVGNLIHPASVPYFQGSRQAFQFYRPYRLGNCRYTASRSISVMCQFLDVMHQAVQMPLRINLGLST